MVLYGSLLLCLGKPDKRDLGGGNKMGAIIKGFGSAVGYCSEDGRPPQ